jgi:putative colanic acid biosynthesis acetyltransferase WcaF
MTAHTTRLDIFDNQWYKPASKLKAVAWYFINVLFFINPLNPASALKVWLLRLFGAKIGVGVLIKPSVNIKYPWLLQVGNHVWIGENVWIDNLAQVTIGDHVCLSQGAMLLCGNHNYKQSTFDLMIGAITIENGAWVGCRATVCPNVTLHSHAVLSVGAVATQNCTAYSIYSGNPATLTKQRIIEK